MYVLCTLAVLTLHSLLKSWNNKALESGRRSEGGGQRDRPEDGGVPEVWGASRSQRGGDDAVKVERRGARSCRAEGKRRRGGGAVRNVPDSRKRGQVSRWRSGSDTRGSVFYQLLWKVLLLKYRSEVLLL